MNSKILPLFLLVFLSLSVCPAFSMHLEENEEDARIERHLNLIERYEEEVLAIEAELLKYSEESLKFTQLSARRSYLLVSIEIEEALMHILRLEDELAEGERAPQDREELISELDQERSRLASLEMERISLTRDIATFESSSFEGKEDR